MWGKSYPHRDSIPGSSWLFFTYLHLVLRVKINGAVPSLPPGAFMMWEGANFSFQPVDEHLGPKHVAINNKIIVLAIFTTGCPTRYQTRHFFNNSETNEDIATKFEQQYVLFLHNEVSPFQISLQYPH
jgi:hypothetical protein